MQETDLIWMSLLIFIPTIFAVGVLFFPKGWEEGMRWWSLFGTALTLGVSLCIFVLWYAQNIERHAGNLEEASLNFRADQLDRGFVGEPQKAQDWMTKVPWIPRFNINYFLGLDGISMAL